jgi:hypothetical protein
MLCRSAVALPSHRPVVSTITGHTGIGLEQAALQGRSFFA